MLTQEAGGETELLSWTVHLLRLRPARTTWVVAAVGAGVLLAQVAFGSVGLTLLSALLLVGALSQFFFPVRYTLTNRGVRTSHLGIFTDSVRWEDLAGYRHLGDGLLLTRRKARRKGGIILYFSGNEEEVVRVVAKWLPQSH